MARKFFGYNYYILIIFQISLPSHTEANKPSPPTHHPLIICWHFRERLARPTAFAPLNKPSINLRTVTVAWIWRWRKGVVVAKLVHQSTGSSIDHFELSVSCFRQIYVNLVSVRACNVRAARVFKRARFTESSGKYHFTCYFNRATNDVCGCAPDQEAVLWSSDHFTLPKFLPRRCLLKSHCGLLQYKPVNSGRSLETPICMKYLHLDLNITKM